MNSLVVYYFSIFLLLLYTNVEGKCVSSKRDIYQRQLFMNNTGYPNGRKGYVVDHITPLCAGGADNIYNMQWQTTKESYAKDIKERQFCHVLWGK